MNPLTMVADSVGEIQKKYQMYYRRLISQISKNDAGNKLLGVGTFLRNKLIAFTKWVRNHAFISSLLYITAIVLLISHYSDFLLEGADDFTVSMLYFGAYGECSIFNLVSNCILGIIMVFLHKLFPWFNVFTATLFFSVFGCFVVLNYLLFKHADAKGMRYAFILTVLEIDFFIKIQYTRSAILLAFAGVLLLYDGFFFQKSQAAQNETNHRFRKRIKAFFIYGTACVMLLLSSLIRYNCLYLGILFGLIFVVPSLCSAWRHRKNREQTKKAVIKFASFGIIIAGTVVCCLLLKSWGNDITYSSEEMMTYKDYNKARAISDYLPREYTPVSDGDYFLSKNDFTMLKRSIIYDKYFDENFWQKTSEALNHKKVFEPYKNFINIQPNLFRYNQGMNIGSRTLFRFWLLIFLSALVGINRQNCVQILVTLGVSLSVLSYFLLIGRLPPWVVDPIYLMGSASCLFAVAKYPPTKNSIACSIRRVLSIGLVLVCIFGGIKRAKHSMNEYKCDLNFKSTLEYAYENKDKIYLIDSTAYIPYPIINIYGTFHLIPEGEWSNVLRVGNWDTKHPAIERQLKKLGIESPLYSLLSDNVYLITYERDAMIAPYQTFFAEHYNIDCVDYDVVSKRGNWIIVKMYVSSKPHAIKKKFGNGCSFFDSKN